MLYEPTTLAATASALAAALTDYGVDAHALFREAGIDLERMLVPGARFPFRAMQRLWRGARDATGDPCIGLVAAEKLKPPALHALGLAWLASPTLLEGLRRMERYSHIVSTVLRFELTEGADTSQFTRQALEAEQPVNNEAVDAVLAVIVKMCRAIDEPTFAPSRVMLRHADHTHRERYERYFGCPVEFGAPVDALEFDSQRLRKPMPAGNHELAYRNDRMAERYLATLNPETVQDEVRKILLTLLPSGEPTLAAVAASLNKSMSTLQRRLKSEGLSYRTLLERTRQELAEELLAEHRYALSQITYLLGFSDQANFSRAFKRWTGRSPAAFRRGT